MKPYIVTNCHSTTTPEAIIYGRYCFSVFEAVRNCDLGQLKFILELRNSDINE